MVGYNVQSAVDTNCPALKSPESQSPFAFIDD
jgi:hypothetical protein